MANTTKNLSDDLLNFCAIYDAQNAVITVTIVFIINTYCSTPT